MEDRDTEGKFVKGHKVSKKHRISYKTELKRHRDLIVERGSELIQKAIDLALIKDNALVDRECLNSLVAILVPRSKTLTYTKTQLEFDDDAFDTFDNINETIGGLIQLAANGTLSHEEKDSYIESLVTKSKFLELRDIVSRIEALENK